MNLHAIRSSVANPLQFSLHTFYAYHLVPVPTFCCETHSINRKYTLHQTEYRHLIHNVRSNDWKHALSQHHDIYQNCYCGSTIRNAIVGICQRSAIAVEARLWRATSASIYNTSKSGQHHIELVCCKTTQLRGKGTRNQKAATELELGTYIRGFCHMSLIFHYPTCTSHGCTCVCNRLRPIPRGWCLCSEMVVSSAGNTASYTNPQT